MFTEAGRKIKTIKYSLQISILWNYYNLLIKLIEFSIHLLRELIVCDYNKMCNTKYGSDEVSLLYNASAGLSMISIWK